MTEMRPDGTKTPLIAVAICLYGSLELIERQLDALGDQTLNRAAFEIIVVVGGDRSAAISPLIKSRPHLPIHVIDRPEINPAILRNVALAHAAAPLILFLGPFDQPSMSLLAEHERSHRLFPESNVVVQGYNGFHPDIARHPIAQFLTNSGRLGPGYAEALSDRWLGSDWFTEGRCSCKCAFLSSSGSFDPEFGAGAAWADLAQRLLPQGLRILYNSRAISTIIGPANFEAFCLESEQQGQADRTLIRRYPNAIVARKSELLQSADRKRMLRARSEQLFAVTRRLNDIAEARAAYDIEADRDFAALLHSHYADTLDAFWLRGIEASGPEADRVIA